MITPKYTREIPQRYRLEAGRCTGCGFIAFPPRLVCPECDSRVFEKISLTPSGTILTYLSPTWPQSCSIPPVTPLLPPIFMGWA